MIGLMNQSKTLIKEKVKDCCNILHFHLKNQSKKYSYHYALSCVDEKLSLPDEFVLFHLLQDLSANDC